MTEANFQLTPGFKKFYIWTFFSYFPGGTCLLIPFVLQSNLFIARLNKISTQVNQFLKCHFLVCIKQKEQNKEKTKQKKWKETDKAFCCWTYFSWRVWIANIFDGVVWSNFFCSFPWHCSQFDSCVIDN